MGSPSSDEWSAAAGKPNWPNDSRLNDCCVLPCFLVRLLWLLYDVSYGGFFCDWNVRMVYSNRTLSHLYEAATFGLSFCGHCCWLLLCGFCGTWRGGCSLAGWDGALGMPPRALALPLCAPPMRFPSSDGSLVPGNICRRSASCEITSKLSPSTASGDSMV